MRLSESDLHVFLVDQVRSEVAHESQSVFFPIESDPIGFDVFVRNPKHSVHFFFRRHQERVQNGVHDFYSQSERVVGRFSRKLHELNKQRCIVLTEWVIELVAFTSEVLHCVTRIIATVQCDTFFIIAFIDFCIRISTFLSAYNDIILIGFEFSLKTFFNTLQNSRS